MEWSTEMTTTIFTETIRQSADKGSLVGPIIIDLAKVFDTIRHSLVLIKLQSYGILGTELAWFTDYLFNRHCIVNYPSSAQCFDLNRLFRWNRSRDMTTTIFTETVRRSVLLKKNQHCKRISNSYQLVSGVPEGSILGLLLFIIFFNDIAKISNIVNF